MAAETRPSQPVAAMTPPLTLGSWTSGDGVAAEAMPRKRPSSQPTTSWPELASCLQSRITHGDEAEVRAGFEAELATLFLDYLDRGADAWPHAATAYRAIPLEREGSIRRSLLARSAAAAGRTSGVRPGHPGPSSVPEQVSAPLGYRAIAAARYSVTRPACKNYGTSRILQSQLYRQSGSLLQPYGSYL